MIEQPSWFRTLGSIGWIDVGVFFFISGYGLSYGYHRKPDYFKTFPKRFCNVTIPFLVAHIVYMVGDTLFKIQFSFNDVIESLLGNSMLVRNDWYVPVCLLFYLLFWMIFKSEMRDGNKLLVLFVSVCTYVFFSSRVLQQSSCWWMNALPFFGGVWWQKICEQDEREQGNRRQNYAWLRRAAVCIAGYAVAYAGVPLSNRILGVYEYEICYNLMSFFGVGMIILLYSRVGRSNKITAFLSTISYEIYLYHGLFIDGFRSDSLYIRNDIFYVFAVYVATIVLSIGMHYAVERVRRSVAIEI